MTRFAMGAGLIAAWLVGLAGCMSRTPSRVYPDRPDPRAGAVAIELYDRNHDGFLEGEELDQVPGLKAAMKAVDTNRDGKISAEEITARLKYWDVSRIGRMPVICTVTRKGKALAGAEVRFVPEKFLGAALKTGSGTTDMAGIARVVAAGGEESIQGMSPGFYRVEITKPGEVIPAKYNRETTLGQEVAPYAEGMVGGIKFDLK